MSAIATTWVWQRSSEQGTRLLVLLALADNANGRFEAELSTRDLARLCRVSKSRSAEIIRGLLDTGHIAIVSTGAGRGNPSKYRITMDAKVANRSGSEKAAKAPDKEAPQEGSRATTAKAESPETVQFEPPVNLPLQNIERLPPTARDVKRVIDAGRVNNPGGQAFYWARTEHLGDLDDLLLLMDMDVAGLCDRIATAERERPGQFRSITRLSQIGDRLMEAER